VPYGILAGAGCVRHHLGSLIDSRCTINWSHARVMALHHDTAITLATGLAMPHARSIRTQNRMLFFHEWEGKKGALWLTSPCIENIAPKRSKT
jgi:hypothetical protein